MSSNGVTIDDLISHSIKHVRSELAEDGEMNPVVAMLGGDGSLHSLAVDMRRLASTEVEDGMRRAVEETNAIAYLVMVDERYTRPARANRPGRRGKALLVQVYQKDGHHQTMFLPYRKHGGRTVFSKRRRRATPVFTTGIFADPFAETSAPLAANPTQRPCAPVCALIPGSLDMFPDVLLGWAML